MKRKYFILLILLPVIFLAVLAFAKFKNSKTDAFSQADVFPQGALIYVQFEDLTELFNLWNKSYLKNNYLESANYQEFSNSHLALKLAERFDEYEQNLGFPLDNSTIYSFGEKKAALAVYDIGRMEIVFVAPMSKEKILATRFFQNFSRFDEQELENGQKFYIREIEVDREREKQKVLFAETNGYFVLATSELMFLKTLKNIGGKSTDKTLSSEFDFKNLAQKISPHLATVWVNQAKLNNNWYFKHYWLMKNLEDLKNIRAGIFDLEMRNDGLIEHRIFLSETKFENLSISPKETEDLQSFIPPDMPFYEINSGKNLRILNQVLLDSPIIKTGTERYNEDYHHIYNEEYEPDWYSYDYLGNDFDERINEIEEAEDFKSAENAAKSEIRLFSELEKTLAAGRPTAAARLVKPQNLPAPMFFECRKAAIFTLQNPKNLNREKLEDSIAALAKNRLTLGESDERPLWKTQTENQISWRELSFPMLRWNFFYAIKNREIIFANSLELLKEILNNKSENLSLPENFLNSLTVIRFNEREKTLDGIMKTLKQEENKNRFANPVNQNHIPEVSDFFVDNVGSLLDAAKNIKQMEIRRASGGVYLFEELKFVY